MKHTLEADSIYLQFGATQILSGIYLKLETGVITGLLGRNGTGKTSLINIIYGSLNGNNKSIRFDQNYIEKAYKTPDLISFLPQHSYIPKSLTLKRVFSDFNVDYGLFINQFDGFDHQYNSKVRELSGGQSRLVELFLVLKSNSKFVMLDEPFSHLTPVLTERVKSLIQECAINKGILITDHVYQHVLDLSDELYLLTGGNIRSIKETQELIFYGYLKTAY